MRLRRRLVFEGRVETVGLLFRDDSVGHERILRAWEPGAVVRRVGSWLFVRSPEARWVDAEAAPGTPVVSLEGLLTAAPLTRAEQEHFATMKERLVVAQAGGLSALLPGELVDCASWVEVAPATVEPVDVPRPVALAPPPPPPPLVLRPDPSTLPPEAGRALTEALQSTSAVPVQPLWRRMATWALRWIRARRSPQLPDGAPRPKGLLRRLEDATNRLLDRTALGRALDDFNRRYVDRLLRQFEREDLDSALRHAVPLSRKPAAPGAERSARPLAPRRDLSLNLRGRGSDGAAGVLAPGVYDVLKTRYRTAAEQLEKSGRIDEAAFVLADLLDAPAEAVSLLERHGRHETAAQLAESRSLEADLSVRLWLVAGNTDRAVALARRHRAFAGAVGRLERAGDEEHAASLRFHWAQGLAAGGDFAGAEEVVARLPGTLGLRLRWIDLGIEAGGPRAPELLVRKLDLAPAGAAKELIAAKSLLETQDEASAPLRATLADALVRSAEVASLEQRRSLARWALRAMVRDEARFGAQRPGIIGRLMKLDDGPLGTDVPGFIPGVRPVEGAPGRFEAEPAALTPFDAVVLPNGSLLVALGENGLAIVTRDRRVTWRSELPARSLVIGDDGLVLGLMPREDVTHVTRITPAPRRAMLLAQLSLTAACSSFRDGTWFVAQGTRLLGLDVLGDSLTPLWEVPSNAPPGQRIAAMASSEGELAVLFRGEVELSRGAWRLPSFELSHAGPITAGNVTEAMANAGATWLVIGRDAEARLLGWRNGSGPALPIPGRLAGTVSVDGGESIRRGPCGAVPVQWREETPDQVDVLVIPFEDSTRNVMTSPRRMSFGFGGATRVNTRTHGGQLVMSADNGRVVVFDLVQQRLTHDVVVRP